MRKLQHLEGLRAQVSMLRQENGQILAALNAITNHYLAVEAEHSVLRTQQMELSFRLQSLNEILHFLDGSFSGSHAFEITDGFCNP